MNMATRTFALITLLTLTLIGCGLFQPPPSETQSQEVTLPAPITSGLVSSVSPSTGAGGIAPNTTVTVSFNGSVDQASAIRGFAVLPGIYTTNIGMQKLTLTAMCNGRWRVRNPSTSTVVFTWDVYNTAEKGSGIVPASADVFFTTTLGQKTVRVFVAAGLHNTKAANTTTCTSPQPDFPGKLAGDLVWSGNALTFTPAQSLLSRQAYTVFAGLNTPFASAFQTGNGLQITGAEPNSFTNSSDAVVTLRGDGFTATTSFFIQSNRLDVLEQSATSVKVRVTAGFLPSVYGVMAANPDGARATFYPGVTISAGTPPRAIDPQRNARAYVVGYAVDFASQQPVAGARVSLNSLIGRLETITDAGGYYAIRGVPLGKQAFRIEKSGYEPVYRTANITSAAQTVTLKLAALEPKSTRVTTIGTSGGTHYATDAGAAGPFLQVPVGALDRDTPIQFTHLRDATTLPELPQDGYYLAFAHLGPTGLTFKKPATLFLPLQPGVVVPVGTRINIFYFDAKRAEWVDDITSGKISNVNGKLYLEYEINHFTWIGGTSPTPVVQVTGNLRYANGRAASGIVTNYGTSDAQGLVRGTATSSSSDRSLTLKVIGELNSPSASATSTGLNDVNFPPITLPSPQPVVPPSVLIPQPVLDPGDQPTSDPCADRPVSPLYYRMDGNQQLDPGDVLIDPQRVKRIVWDLPDAQRRLDPATIRAFVDGNDVTNKLNISFLCKDKSIRAILDFTEPLTEKDHRMVLTACERDAMRNNTPDNPIQTFCLGILPYAGLASVPSGTPGADQLLESRTGVSAATLYAPNIAVAVVPDAFFGGIAPYHRTPTGALAITVSQSQAQSGFVTIEVPVSSSNRSLNTPNKFYFTNLSASLPGAVSSGAPFVNGIANIPIKVPISSGAMSLLRLGTVTSNDPNASPAANNDPAKPPGYLECSACRVFQQDVLPRPRGKPSNYESNAPMVVAQPTSFWNNVGDWWRPEDIALFQFLEFSIGFLPVIGPGIDCAKAAVQLLANQEVNLLIAEIGCIGMSFDAIAAASAVVSGGATLPTGASGYLIIRAMKIAANVSHSAGGFLSRTFKIIIEKFMNGVINVTEFMTAVRDVFGWTPRVLEPGGETVARNLETAAAAFAVKCTLGTQSLNLTDTVIAAQGITDQACAELIQKISSFIKDGRFSGPGINLERFAENTKLFANIPGVQTVLKDLSREAGKLVNAYNDAKGYYFQIEHARIMKDLNNTVLSFETKLDSIIDVDVKSIGAAGQVYFDQVKAGNTYNNLQAAKGITAIANRIKSGDSEGIYRVISYLPTDMSLKKQGFCESAESAALAAQITIQALLERVFLIEVDSSGVLRNYSC